MLKWYIGHVQSHACGRAPPNIKERVETIITSVDDCWDNPASIPAGLLKTDVSPVLPLQKWNLLVGFQSNSSTGIDNGLYPDCVTNQGQIGYVTVCMPAVLTGGQVQIQVRKFTERWRDVHEDDNWRCLVGTTQQKITKYQADFIVLHNSINFQVEVKEIEVDLPKEGG